MKKTCSDKSHRNSMLLGQRLNQIANTTQKMIILNYGVFYANFLMAA